MILTGLFPLPFLLLVLLQSPPHAGAASLGPPRALIIAWPLPAVDEDSVTGAAAVAAAAAPLAAETSEADEDGTSDGQSSSSTSPLKRALSILSRWRSFAAPLGPPPVPRSPARRRLPSLHTPDMDFVSAETRGISSAMRPVGQPLRWGR